MSVSKEAQLAQRSYFVLKIQRLEQELEQTRKTLLTFDKRIQCSHDKFDTVRVNGRYLWEFKECSNCGLTVHI